MGMYTLLQIQSCTSVEHVYTRTETHFSGGHVHTRTDTHFSVEHVHTRIDTHFSDSDEHVHTSWSTRQSADAVNHFSHGLVQLPPANWQQQQQQVTGTKREQKARMKQVPLSQ